MTRSLTHRALFERLLGVYGPQHWWPGDGPFETMVGAVLTQNTAWTGVERAVACLKAAGALDPERLLAEPVERVAAWIRPAGTFNVKAERLRVLCGWLQGSGGYEALAGWETAALRRALLGVKGVGPETADAILLYAFSRPVFVVDAYARRIGARLGLFGDAEPYETLRVRVEHALPADPDLLGEYHALLVRHAKDPCKAKPRCTACSLAAFCPRAGETVSRSAGA